MLSGKRFDMTKKTYTLILGASPELSETVFENVFLANAIKNEIELSSIVNRYKELGRVGIVLSRENCPKVAKLNFEMDVDLSPLAKRTGGALGSIGMSLGYIPEDCAVLIAPIDAYVKSHVADFVERAKNELADAAVLSFRGNDPKYSYLRVKNEQVVELVEKRIVSAIATTGITYFSSKQQLINCIEWAIINNVQREGVFYIAPALNYFVSSGLKLVQVEIPSIDYQRLELNF
jgi:dTDP-glucose pyrophosphorylase